MFVPDLYPELSTEELAEALDYLSQEYGETYSQHKGETARFGDSWPGAQIQLHNMWQNIRQVEIEIAARTGAISYE